MSAGGSAGLLGIARISTEHQNALSLEDQEAFSRRWLAEHTDLSYRLTMISGRGSGECLDREEARRAENEVESCTYDLVIAEDLGRIFRRIHALLFCELCEDVGTRLIALNDHVDTAQDNWRVLAGFASMRNEMYNADTAKRIRRSLRNRFQMGGVIQSVVFGIIKPPGAKTDDELKKDSAAEPVYDEMFRKVEEDGASYSEIADWLTDLGVKSGPAARSGRWTGSAGRPSLGKEVRDLIRRSADAKTPPEPVRMLFSGGTGGKSERPVACQAT
jgi:DNA invertase Pin-like site-specific DNA recombinase